MNNRSLKNGVTGVVSDHGESDVGVGAKDGEGAVAAGGERERTKAVLKEDKALAGGVDGELAVAGAADVLRAQVVVGVGGEIAVEHSEAHLDGESVGQCGIDMGFLH